MNTLCDGVASIHSDLRNRRLVFIKLVYHQCVGVWADQVPSVWKLFDRSGYSQSYQAVAAEIRSDCHTGSGM